MARVPMRPLALSFLISLLLAACAVGPDFAGPPALPPDVALVPPDSVSTGARMQRFVHGGDVRGDWWRLFSSKELAALIDRARRDNHDLKAVQAALRVAHANYRAQQGALFPVVGANISSTDQKASTSVLSSPTVSGDPFYTLQTGQLTISYVPDVFGGIRRQVEAASAQEESQFFALEAAYLTLTSNIALAVIQEASLNDQIEATQETIDHEQLYVLGENLQAAFRSASPKDWAAMRAALAQAEQTLPLLQKQLAAQRDLLTALTGHFAGEGLYKRFTLSKPGSRRLRPNESRLSLPKGVPAMLSSQIVERRPDVRAAQANLHTAMALVGVAVANRLPLFNISGNIGRSGSQFGDLLNPAPPFLFWTAAGSVTQTIFDGFTLEQRQRAAEAGWKQVEEQYRSTVVTAFQNVADVLQAIDLDAKSAKKAKEAEAAARENLCLTVAAFVGYRLGANLKTAEFANVDTTKLDSTQLDELKRSFGKWWKKVCLQDEDVRQRLEDWAKRSAQSDAPSACAARCEAAKKQADRCEPGKSDARTCNAAKCEAERCDAAASSGSPSGIDVLTSEQLLLSTKLSRITAEASRYADVVALYQALGGGWWNRRDVEAPPDPGFFAVEGPIP